MTTSQPSELGSVSRWIDQVRRGCDSAVANLWGRYQDPIHMVADRELGRVPRSVADEEDVAILAFSAFIRRTREGGYDQMLNRDDLWRLLATITRSYAWKQTRFLSRLKRKCPAMAGQKVLSQLASSSPSPDAMAAISEMLDTLLVDLEDDELRNIALGRLFGYSNKEIAENLGRSERTIERRTAIIRSIWEKRL